MCRTHSARGSSGVAGRTAVASGQATTSLAATTGDKSVVPLLPVQRLGTNMERVQRWSYETNVVEEKEERREQMDLVGRGGGFGAICYGVGMSGWTWRTRPGAPISAPYLGWI